MLRGFIISICLLLGQLSYAQEIADIDKKNAVTIGNIDMETVIIHVYKTKTDQWPYKEFSIVTDEKTGEKKVVDNAIKGKTSEGGFIIVNGLKTVDELNELLADEKVYDEIVVNDVDSFQNYEPLISAYLTNTILETAVEEQKQEDETESETSEAVESEKDIDPKITEVDAPKRNKKFKPPTYKSTYGKRDSKKMRKRYKSKNRRATKCYRFPRRKKN